MSCPRNAAGMPDEGGVDVGGLPDVGGLVAVGGLLDVGGVVGGLLDVGGIVLPVGGTLVRENVVEAGGVGVGGGGELVDVDGTGVPEGVINVVTGGETAGVGTVSTPPVLQPATSRRTTATSAIGPILGPRAGCVLVIPEG